MKNRIEHLENQNPELDDPKKLIEIGNKWRTAFYEDDSEQAQKFRKQAEPFFEKYPEYLNDAPEGTNKNLYIDWEKFVNYK